MLKNKPRKSINRRAFGPPRGRLYRRNQPHGKYLVRPVDPSDRVSVPNRFFASRPKARAYARRLADALGKTVSMLNLDMFEYGSCKRFNPKNRTKC